MGPALVVNEGAATSQQVRRPAERCRRIGRRASRFGVMKQTPPSPLKKPGLSQFTPAEAFPVDPLHQVNIRPRQAFDQLVHLIPWVCVQKVFEPLQLVPVHDEARVLMFSCLSDPEQSLDLNLFPPCRLRFIRGKY